MNDLLLFCELLPQRITRCNSDTGRRRLPSLCLSGNWSLHDGDTSPWGKRYKLWGQYKSVFLFLFFWFCFFFCEFHRRYNVDRAIFNWVSKIIRDCTGFALRRSVIGPGILAPISQSIRCKLKPITTWSLAFSSAFPRSRQFSCVYPGLSLAIKGKKIYRLAIAITLVLV